MTFDELKSKALSLPYEPGVYIMRNKDDKVIYVGKAKKLKNRVSQYFQDTASHTLKTRMMVSKIDHFDVIVAASEFEALILENSLIKRYMPKYNILLKDDKGYPYLRINPKEDYPRITLVNKLSDDGAGYYGPYGSRGVTQSLLDTIQTILKLPDCTRKFPRDIGKDRPCLSYHMNKCAGWCTGKKSREEYVETIEKARQLLLGNYKLVADGIRAEMITAADRMEFELAASLRDRLTSVEALGQKQMVTAGKSADIDVIGYAQTEAKACFSVLHFSEGNLKDKDYEVFSVPDEPEAAVFSLLSQYYLSRGLVPKIILLPFALEDTDLLVRLFSEKFGVNTQIKVPQRGDNVRLVELAQKNAAEEAERVTSKEERSSATWNMLAKMLRIDELHRIESFDISNISGTDMVASMVVFQDGRAYPKGYKRFRIEDLVQQDDYASMQQVVERRFRHYINVDAGFSEKPDLLLIDGGQAHAAAVRTVLHQLQLDDIPLFGMVKDDRHRTRALITPDGEEIRIDNQQSVFALIGNIQEETHRFAITYHRQLRSKRLRYSELDKIPGVGPKRKQQLLKTFKSLSAIRGASLSELERVLPKDTAFKVYHYFHEERKDQ